MAKKKKLFCELNPVCYEISLQKEILKRHISDMMSKERFATEKSNEKLPVTVSDHSSHLIKKGKGIDPTLQYNKATNIELAGGCINGLIIHPGEVFSFWRTVGNTTKRKGYKDGRVIIGDKLQPGIGGGLCNLANTIHWLFLHSPLEVVEFHNHSDALAPDGEKRIPFATGTSVSYNNVDYRVKNTTDRDVQLLVWCADETLYAELRSGEAFPWRYELAEEDHHFCKEGEKYYRISKIYRLTIDKQTDEVIDKKLVLDNHSEVMFDYDMIPKELIRQ